MASSVLLFLLVLGKHSGHSLSKSKKSQAAFCRYSKSLITYKNASVNVVGRDPSEKRSNLLLLLVLFQHPLEIIWNYQNSLLWS